MTVVIIQIGIQIEVDFLPRTVLKPNLQHIIQIRSYNKYEISEKKNIGVFQVILLTYLPS